MSRRIQFFAFTTIGSWLAWWIFGGSPDFSAGWTCLALVATAREIVLYKPASAGLAGGDEAAE